MRSVTWFVVLGMAVASSVQAQSASQFPPAPPPPGIHDPGVKAVAPPPAPAAKQSAPAASADTTATLSQPATSAPQSQPRDARGEAPPQVTVHTEGEQTVQEYRRSGQLYMVVVTSRAGITQTYMVDQKGAWTNQAGEPVKPVMYKVMEWGKSKSAEDQDNGGK